MRIIHMFKERGDELREYKKALKMAKESIDTICELSDEMEDEYSERGDYGERYSNRGDYGERRGYSSRSYSRRDHDWDDMEERRYRDSMGRYR